MSYFKRNSDAVVSALLSFPTVSETTMQMFNCKNGERAGFRIITLDGGFVVSQIFDYSSGAGVLVGTVSALAETDLSGGMFSSGCFCDSDPLTAGAKFYLVDYV